MSNGDFWQPTVKLSQDIKRRLEAFERAYAAKKGIPQAVVGHTFALPHLLDQALTAEGFPPVDEPAADVDDIELARR